MQESRLPQTIQEENTSPWNKKKTPNANTTKVECTNWRAPIPKWNKQDKQEGRSELGFKKTYGTLNITILDQNSRSNS